MMKKLVLLTLITIILIAGCGQATPDANAINTAIAKTEEAKPTPTFLPPPTETIAVTNTLEPTSTPEVISTPTLSLEVLQQQLIDLTVDMLEGLDEVETVSVVRIQNGVYEIELRTIWASKDSQPDISYDVIRIFAEAMSSWDISVARKMFETENPVIHITTYSTDGDYRYQSDTSWDTLQRLYRKAISYEEWVIEANAGFR